VVGNVNNIDLDDNVDNPNDIDQNEQRKGPPPDKLSADDDEESDEESDGRNRNKNRKNKSNANKPNYDDTATMASTLDLNALETDVDASVVSYLGNTTPDVVCKV